MTIVFVLWCLGLKPVPVKVTEYRTEAACVAQQREASQLVLELSKVAPDVDLTPVAYVCMATARQP